MVMYLASSPSYSTVPFSIYHHAVGDRGVVVVKLAHFLQRECFLEIADYFSDRFSVPDPDSPMELPILTEDEIFSEVINPPSSSTELGASAEDPSDWFRPEDDCNVPKTKPPAIIKLQVHLVAIDGMSSREIYPVAEAPKDWRIEKMSEAPATWDRGPRCGALPNNLRVASPAEVETLEFAKRYSNLYYPFLLPNGKALSHRTRVNLEPQSPEKLDSVEYPPVQEFSLPSPAPVEVEQYVPDPFPVLAQNFSFATPPLPQSAFAPLSYAPAEISTMMTTTKIANMATNYNYETVAGNDMSSSIEVLHKQVISGAPSVPHALGSECQLNHSNPLSPIDWSDAIDNMPAMPPPDLEFPSPYMGTPSMMSAGTPTTMVAELVPAVPVFEQGQTPCFVEHGESIQPPVEASFSRKGSQKRRKGKKQGQTPSFAEQYECIRPPVEASFSPTGVQKRRKGKKQAQTPSFAEQYECIRPPVEASFSPIRPKKHRQDEQPELQEGGSPRSSHPKVGNVLVKNARLKWTQELHARFEKAIGRLGGPQSIKASPKHVHRMMNCANVTIYHVKSHLQKYRTSVLNFVYGGAEFQLPRMRGSLPSKRESRSSKASSAEPSQPSQPTAEQAAQQVLAGTLAQHQEMQEQLPQLMEKSMELQARIDVIEKRGEQLQKMMDEQVIILDR